MQVTDDLFDEIAQEVMDEDEQRLLEGLAFAFGYMISVFISTVASKSFICLFIRGFHLVYSINFLFRETELFRLVFDISFKLKSSI